MTPKIESGQRVLRQRFGQWLKERREDAGIPQLAVAQHLGYSYVATVSQIERGVSALPSQDINLWAEALKVKPKDLAKKYLYYVMPDIYEGLFGESPYDIEKVERPPKSISAAARQPAAKSQR